MFEYLMPLLVMRSFPETLLDESCRMAVRRQIDYAATHGTPWGISESAYTATDRHGTYQYKAFGVPGLGLKRGLGDELVIAPYATALAVLIDPARSARNLRRLADAKLLGDYGFYEVDRLHRANRARRHRRHGTVVPAVFAHHAGMSLVAIANALTGDRMIERFHADPRVRATERLLQERVPRQQPVREPRPNDETFSPSQGIERAGSPLPHRADRLPAYPVPLERQVRRGDHQRRRRRQHVRAVERHPIAPRCDARSRQLVHLPARHPQRLGLVADLSAGAPRAGVVHRDLPAGHRDVREPRRGRRLETGDRGVGRARRRAAPAAAGQPQRARARDRRHQLHRGGAGAGARRLRASGVRQAVHRDRVPGRPRRADLPPPSA